MLVSCGVYILLWRLTPNESNVSNVTDPTPSQEVGCDEKKLEGSPGSPGIPNSSKAPQLL